MRDVIYIAVICFGVIFGYQLGYQLGTKDGFKDGIKTTHTNAAVDISKQCVAWFFDTNLKDVKKKICGGKPSASNKTQR